MLWFCVQDSCLSLGVVIFYQNIQLYLDLRSHESRQSVSGLLMHVYGFDKTSQVQAETQLSV